MVECLTCIREVACSSLPFCTLFFFKYLTTANFRVFISISLYIFQKAKNGRTCGYIMGKVEQACQHKTYMRSSKNRDKLYKTDFFGKKLKLKKNFLPAVRGRRGAPPGFFTPLFPTLLRGLVCCTPIRRCSIFRTSGSATQNLTSD